MKPCPFCGSEPLQTAGKFYCQCKICPLGRTTIVFTEDQWECRPGEIVDETPRNPGVSRPPKPRRTMKKG